MESKKGYYHVFQLETDEQDKEKKTRSTGKQAQADAAAARFHPQPGRDTESRREGSMYEAGDLRKGLKLEIDGEPYIIVDFDFVKPGKGQALYKCKLKNLITGSQFDRTYRSVDRFQPANMDEQKMEFLYKEGDHYCFMNTSTYEQVHMEEDQVGEAKNYLLNNLVVDVLFFQERPIDINLPIFVDLKVAKAEPGIKGDTASGASKPVTLETGYVIQVPLFIEQGELLRLDTRSGQYVSRVKDTK